VVTVSRTKLGAWLMRRSPASADLSALTGSEISGQWCVRRSYRLALIRPGDRVLLWLSGRHPVRPRGIWAIGEVTDLADERLGVRLAPLARPLTDCRLRSAGVDDLEVQRQPMGSNPSWVSREQWSRITALLAAADQPDTSLRRRGDPPRSAARLGLE
jgi:hypothetical protein